jgi:hypothetical protein
MSTLLCLLPALLHAEPAAAPSGLHVEARTASVYAGACHYGGESVTAGREALVALRFDGGSIAGEDLAGAKVALLLAADANLEDESLVARARAIVDAPRGAGQERAALLAARAHLGARVLELEGVVAGAVGYETHGDAVEVLVPGVARLAATTMPDRACCKMPQQVWYRPLGAVQGQLVLLCEEFRVDAGSVRFARHDENNGFVARFGAAPGGD